MSAQRENVRNGSGSDRVEGSPVSTVSGNDTALGAQTSLSAMSAQREQIRTGSSSC
jgi:hypothetical protein